MTDFWCDDSEMLESRVIMKIPISGVLWYGHTVTYFPQRRKHVLMPDYEN